MKSNTKKLVFAALMAAIACIATMIIRIPVPATGGYINLGDGIVILSGLLLGPVYGGLAAGIGSALADLFAGYVVYAVATFIIKGLMAVVVGIILKNASKAGIINVIIAGVIAEIIMIAGYFIFEAVFMGFGLGALEAVTGNVIQGIGGIIIAAVLTPAVKKIKI